MVMRKPILGVLAIFAIVAIFAMGCEREARIFRESDVASAPVITATSSDVMPGERSRTLSMRNPYEANAHAIAEGKRLFTWYNCSGCHANGGGGSGPALMDDEWIYGSAPANIFESIVEGRPNGMPSFQGKVPAYQVWQLAAYVQSMTGHVRRDASPSRSDSMPAKAVEAMTDKLDPKQTGSGGIQ
jgi:cytochrome c oxidase cbb3-type subunit III